MISVVMHTVSNHTVCYHTMQMSCQTCSSMLLLLLPRLSRAAWHQHHPPHLLLRGHTGARQGHVQASSAAHCIAHTLQCLGRITLCRRR